MKKQLDFSQNCSLFENYISLKVLAEIEGKTLQLRVTVKEVSKVAEEKEWKRNGALGLILKDNGVQAIYGPKADVLKSDIQD